MSSEPTFAGPTGEVNFSVAGGELRGDRVWQETGMKKWLICSSKAEPPSRVILWDKTISYCIYETDGQWSLLKTAENFLNFLRSYKVYRPCCTARCVMMDSPHEPEIVFVLFIVIVVGKLI